MTLLTDQNQIKKQLSDTEESLLMAMDELETLERALEE